MCVVCVVCQCVCLCLYVICFLLQMQPPVQPLEAKTCSADLSHLSCRLPKGLFLGGAANDGDCFFDTVAQGINAVGIRIKSNEVRLAIKKSWDEKPTKEADEDFAVLEWDTTIFFPPCVTDVETFKNWVILTADYIKKKTLHQSGQSGFSSDFPTFPYWGGTMDLQVTCCLCS